MKIIQIDEFGAPEVLKAREVASPEIQAADEVLVRVHASRARIRKMALQS